MQKKKPPFQVIPNCGVSGFTNWNESKEVAAEQGRNDLGLRNFSDPLQANSVWSIAIAKYPGDIAT
jgi:hypothetical protein